MIQLREQFWAVQVPSMAFGFNVNNYGNESELMYMLSMEDISDEPDTEETLITKKLPPGTWEIVCTSKEVVAGHELGIIDAKEFIDILTSKGCDIKQSYLILKKVA